MSGFELALGIGAGMFLADVLGHLYRFAFIVWARKKQATAVAEFIAAHPEGLADPPGKGYM